MSQACMRLAAGLAAAGKLPPHPAPFNDPAQHFEQRFASFQALQRPEPLTHAQFERSVDLTCACLLAPQHHQGAGADAFAWHPCRDRAAA